MAARSSSAAEKSCRRVGQSPHLPTTARWDSHPTHDPPRPKSRRRQLAAFRLDYAGFFHAYTVRQAGSSCETRNHDVARPAMIK